MPSVAVVIPTKNEERYLPVVLKALQEQTLQPEAVIVADGGSTDKTRVIAASFAGVTVVRGGVVAIGRNAGVLATTADLILFLDADAIIADTHFLEHAVKEFEARTLDFATADVHVQRGSVIDRLAFMLYNRYVRLWGRRHPHLIGTCMLVRRSTHNAIGGFNPAVTFAEDHDYGLRARDAGKIFGVLNSVAIGTTPRRQEHIGRLRFLLVNILAEPYIMLFGPITRRIFSNSYEQRRRT